MSKHAAAEHEASALEMPALAAPETSRRTRAKLSREEYGSYLYAAAFVVVALGCFLITGW